MIKRLPLALLCCVLWAVTCYAQTTGQRPSPLGPGLCSNCSVYNPGNQYPIPDQPIYLQTPVYDPHATSCVINSTCGTANDSGKRLTATATGVTFSTPVPGAPGTAGYSFGYDGSHSYSITSTAGTTIYNCGTTGQTVTGLTYPLTLEPDSSGNWQCIANGGTGGAGHVCGFGTAINASVCQGFITGGTTFSVPADWTNVNTIETIGGGGGGGNCTTAAAGSGGGGGGYSKITNATLTASTSVTIAVGAAGTGANPGTAGGDTWLCNATTNCASIAGTAVLVGAKGGGGGSGALATNAGGVGGASASGIGATKFSGGNGGAAGPGGAGGAGGGGAAGPSGAGLVGGVAAVAAADNGGAGGGAGNSNGTSTAGVAGTGSNGANGGVAQDGSAGGTGSPSGTAPGPGNPGSHGSGGGGGGQRTASGAGPTGGAGGNGIEFDAAHGAGGGGGGGGESAGGLAGGPGGAGGLYGGGSAGSGFGAGGVCTAPASAGSGVISINYTHS